MNITLKQFMGWVVMLLFALPALFGSIWAVGLSQGALSRQVMADAPRQIIPHIPEFIDLSFAEAQKPGAITDANTMAWVDAAAKLDKTPRQLMEETGIINWLNSEVTSGFTQLGDMLEGKTPAKDIAVDMRPLKQAFRDPQVQNYMLNLVGNLPACSQSQILVWQRIAAGQKLDQEAELPACNPGTYNLMTIAQNLQDEIEKIPDTAQATQGLSGTQQPLNITRTVSTVASFAFIFPVLFLLLGSYLTSELWSRRLRYAGIITLIAGLSALGLAILASNAANIAMLTNPSWLTIGEPVQVSAQYSQAISQWMIPIIQPVVSRLFDPIINLAMWTGLGGLLAVVVSYLLKENTSHIATTVAEPASTKNRPE